MKTLGSLFAGIGGFDLGFERAGWKTIWQVEINSLCREVLKGQFPHAQQYEDICKIQKLPWVDCISAGFPCQDISTMGRCKKREGLKGKRSGLFFEIIRLLPTLKPTWLVLENVPNIISSNAGKDLETVVRALAECGYLGFWRVLNARHFGVPQNRRRWFLVAGLGRYPTIEFLFDAQAMATISSAAFAQSQPRSALGFASYTKTAPNAAGRINLGSEVLVCEENGRHQMVERERGARLYGIPTGLDSQNWFESYASGNAVVPACAQYIAEKLNESDN